MRLLPGLTAEQTRDYLRLKAIQEFREAHERIRFVKPNPAQARFIAEIARPGAFIVINAGGNGSGKTFGLILTIGAILWPALASKHFDAPIFQKWPYPKKLWIISNPAELGETGAIQSAIDELWPKHKYVATRGGKLYNSIFRSDTGFVVELKSIEQDEREFRGANVGGIFPNEPLPENIYRESLARLRKGGICAGALTSLNDHPWLVDGLLNRHNGSDIRILFGGVEENCKDHTPGGTLPHEQIERILAQYPADEQEARRTGKPLSLSGRIYKTWEPSVHVLPADHPIPGDVTHYQATDPAGGKPMFTVWAYIDAAGKIVIYDESPEYEFHGAKDEGWGVADYIRHWRVKEEGRRIERRIIDRHFSNSQFTPGSPTLRQQFADSDALSKHGVQPLELENSYQVAADLQEVETGILKVKDLLAYDKTKNVDATNCPHLYVTANCKNTIKAFNTWGRDPKTGKPLEYMKDPMDAVRYLVNADLEHIVERIWTPTQRPSYGVNSR